MDYPDKPFCIYKITSSDINDMSIYIGASSDTTQRAYSHHKNSKYKKYENSSLYKWIRDTIDNKKVNVLFKILETGYTEDEAFAREVEIIKNYRELGHVILNDTEGGKGPKGHKPWNKGTIMSEEIVQKFKDSHKGQIPWMVGKRHTEETKKLISIKNAERKERGWINPKKKKVYKYDQNMNLLSTYSCLADAGKDNNSHSSLVGEWCRGEKIPRKNNYIWSYIELSK